MLWYIFLALPLAVHGLLDQCEGLECMSKADLIKAVGRYKSDMERIHQGLNKKKVIATPFGRFDSADTCSICNSNPCKNGGTCTPDLNDPFYKYNCDCPDNYTGSHCEIEVKCEPDSCGSNATCSVSNHQINCVCVLGYTGDPYKGCSAKVRSSCTWGDPHYTTFDGLKFDYMGTCPMVYSEPCTALTGGYDNYRVTQKSELYGDGHVSVIGQVDVVFYDQKIHFDRFKTTMYFNSVRVGYPFYWPSINQRNITLDFAGNTFTATSNQMVTVTFTTAGQLCLSVPDVQEFYGETTLCGLAGNIDNNYKNDVRYRNGTVYPVVSQSMPTTSTAYSFDQAEDDWIIQDFFFTTGVPTCAPGVIFVNNTNCPIDPAITTCAPILNAMNGEGVFGACERMGNATIQQLYDSCVYDVCHQPDLKCNVMTNFVQTCMSSLPDTNLGNWRNSEGCPLTCPPHSHYSSCTSSCPSTCSDHQAPDKCNKGCVDGCECEYGYVVDNFVTSQLTCVPIQECGCTDPSGNIHGEGPWLDKNCTLAAACTNGTYSSQLTHCSVYGFCATSATYDMTCQCEPGFTGDGFNCTDIDECLDPNSCGQSKGYGSCQNTLGSYNCTCNGYQTGQDCQDFKPTRNCADLKTYWNKTIDGAYNINLPVPLNGLPAYSDISVYCDMTTQGGGWTLMSHDDGNLMSNKTIVEYQTGFGVPSEKRVWLGLEIVNQITNLQTTSLLVLLTRCGRNNRPPLTTDCTYPSFKIFDSKSNYSVMIPELCEGSETDTFPYNDDGWVRWIPSQMGPSFVTYESEKDDVYCSETLQSTGWWFDINHRCGPADLNGVRFSCSNIPPVTTSYLHWGGDAIGDSWMYLRPASFPNN